VVGFFRWLESKKYKVQVRVFLSRYRGYEICPGCRGSRLRPEALRIRVGGRDIHQVCGLSVREARDFFAHLPLTGGDQKTADRILAEIRRRLQVVSDVGLDYLTLDRPFGTLSGGEAQRLPSRLRSARA
jgi:excinuclease ABC subunit A